MTYQPHQAEDVTLKTALKAAIDAMSPEDRRKFALSLCASVDKLAAAIVENKDALWKARCDDGSPGRQRAAAIRAQGSKA